MSGFNLDKLKSNRKNSFDKLNGQLEQMVSKGYSNPDENKYWKLTTDSAGNGMAIIRFLPGIEVEDIPFVRLFNHGFQGPTGLWYINNCLSTINQDDPVNEMNTRLWNATTDDNSEERRQVRKQKRKIQYVSNIYVIKDPANPDNEGKIFLFKYGKKIFDKINDLMNPQFEDEQKVNPFDLWEGANFRLKARKVDGYPNYDKSEFDSPAPLFKNDDEYAAKLTNVYPLDEIIDPKNFKSYKELKAQLHKVLGISESSGNHQNHAEDDDIDEEIDMSKLGKTSDGPKIKEEKSSMDTSGDDDDLEFFKSLANS